MRFIQTSKTEASALIIRTLRNATLGDACAALRTMSLLSVSNLYLMKFKLGWI